MAASKKVLPPVAPSPMWVVEGSFVIPGTREKVSFGPIRVSAATKQKASADLVGTLNDQFSKELRNVPRVAFQKVGFSPGFALMNLRWTPFVAKSQVKAIEAMTNGNPSGMTAIPQEDRNDPPAVSTETV